MYVRIQTLPYREAKKAIGFGLVRKLRGDVEFRFNKNLSLRRILKTSGLEDADSAFSEECSNLTDEFFTRID